MLSPVKYSERKRCKPSSTTEKDSSSTATPKLLSPLRSIKNLLWTPNKENVDIDCNSPSKKQRVVQHQQQQQYSSDNNHSSSHFISSSPQRQTKSQSTKANPKLPKATSRNLNIDFASVPPSKEPSTLQLHRNKQDNLDTDNNNNNNNGNSSSSKHNPEENSNRTQNNTWIDHSAISTDEECSSSQEECGRHSLKKKHSSLLNTLFSPVFHTLFGQSKHNSSNISNNSSISSAGKTSVDHHEELTDSEQDSPRIVRPTLVSDETLSELSAYEPVEPPTCTDIYDPYLQQEGEEEDNDEEEVGDEEFDPFLFISTLPPPTKEQLSRPVMLPPKAQHHSTKKTLVLDLDETLVHCSVEPVDSAELIFPVLFNSIEYQVHVRKRPHFLDFLKRVSKMFEVVVFTASQEVYANKLLNLLDPNNELIHHRLYRDACVCIDGNYLKDLNILGRELHSTVIVDNSPQAFGFQLDNGIPIESWFEDQSDKELLKLLPFLESLAHAEDVRPLVRQHFKLHERVSLYQQELTVVETRDEESQSNSSSNHTTTVTTTMITTSITSISTASTTSTTTI